MIRRKKQIELTIVVSAPSWMTKQMAKREVRSLINDQCHWGHNGSYDHNFECADESNFRVRRVT